MDFELPEELRLLKKTVRTFVDRELIPVEMHSMDGPSLRPEIRADLERKAKELGLWLLDVPREYGAEGEVSLPGAARREDHGFRAVGARRRLRSRQHAHHRGAPGRSLRDQRLQALD